MSHLKMFISIQQSIRQSVASNELINDQDIDALLDFSKAIQKIRKQDTPNRIEAIDAFGHVSEFTQYLLRKHLDLIKAKSLIKIATSRDLITLDFKLYLLPNNHQSSILFAETYTENIGHNFVGRRNIDWLATTLFLRDDDHHQIARKNLAVKTISQILEICPRKAGDKNEKNGLFEERVRIFNKILIPALRQGDKEIIKLLQGNEQALVEKLSKYAISSYISVDAGFTLKNIGLQRLGPMIVKISNLTNDYNTLIEKEKLLGRAIDIGELNLGRMNYSVIYDYLAHSTLANRKEFAKSLIGTRHSDLRQDLPKETFEVGLSNLGTSELILCSEGISEESPNRVVLDDFMLSALQTKGHKPAHEAVMLYKCLKERGINIDPATLDNKDTYHIFKDLRFSSIDYVTENINLFAELYGEDRLLGALEIACTDNKSLVDILTTRLPLKMINKSNTLKQKRLANDLSL